MNLQRIILGLCCCTANYAWAQTLSPVAPAASPSLEIAIKSGEMNESIQAQVQRVFLTVGTNKFVFIVPHGFRVDGSQPGRIMLSEADQTRFLDLRIVGTDDGSPKDIQTDLCRDMALSRFPGATISKERSVNACGQFGPAFDLKWRNSGGAEQSARVVFIPTNSGILEFSLVTSSNRFEESRHLLAALLASLRSNEKGSLEIVSIPENS